MDVTLKCGLVRVAGAGDRPDWREVAQRLAVVQEVFGVNAKFLGGMRAEDGSWCARSSRLSLPTVDGRAPVG